jgi:hypothetical protein
MRTGLRDVVVLLFLVLTLLPPRAPHHVASDVMTV